MENVTECHLMDDDEGDELSLHSGISNPSDFEEDEEVDYLALELIHHLPPDKAGKLMKNMRAKEKAVQDLLHRNRTLLDSCQRLDDENQTLTEQLKEMEKNTSTVASAAPTAAEPKPAVDSSIFLQMECGKEEKILKLKEENARLAAKVHRLDESSQRFEEALAQARRELKKVQKGQQRTATGNADSTGGSTSHLDQRVLDEEERIYQELQGEKAGDKILEMMQRRQTENRSRVQAALQALLSEDLQRIEHWGSDVAAVLLAVDSVEEQLKHGPKEPKAAKKGKAVTAGSNTRSVSNEEVLEVSAQLLDDFDQMRGHLENVEKVQLSLEQTARGVHDGASSTVSAMDLGSGIVAAEQEAEGMRQQNASMVERVRRLGFAPMVAKLNQTGAAIGSQVASLPPGLIPRHAEECLQEAHSQISALCGQLNEQTGALAELQEETVSFGRRVKALQGSHKTLRTELSNRVTEELQKSASAFEEPLERMRCSLRRQGEAMVKARACISNTLDRLVDAVRNLKALRTEEGVGNTGGEALNNDALLGSLREVRSMAKALISNLQEGGKVLEWRMEQVFVALVGEGTNSSNAGATASHNKTPPVAATSGEVAPVGAGVTDAKKKKNRKKGRAEVAGGAHSNAGAGAIGDANVGAADTTLNSGGGGADVTAKAAACGGQGGSKEEQKQKSSAAHDEDADLRAEFHDAFCGDSDGKEGDDVGNGGRPVVSGPELLQELKSLRNDTEALEARMAERVKARSGSADVDETAEVKPVPARRKKKMYA